MIAVARPALMDRMIQADIASVQMLEAGIQIEIDLSQDQTVKLEGLTAEFLQARVHLLNEAQRASKWNWAYKALNFMRSIGMVFVGAATANVGAVALGVVGLVFESLKASGALEKLAERISKGDPDKRDLIIFRIDMIGTYSMMAVSVASLVVTPNVTLIGQGLRDAVNATQNVTAAGQAIVSIGRGQTGSRRYRHEAECTRISWEIRITNMLSTEQRSKAMDLMDILDQRLRATAESIESYERMTHQLCRV